MSQTPEAARAEIAAIFRGRLIKFAVQCTLLGAVVGALFTIALQFLQDIHDMSLATAWDLFVHLPPWEWMSLAHLGLITLASMVITPLVMTPAFYFAESPRWNR